MAHRLASGASSHIINLTLLNSSVVPLCLLMLHKLESSALIGVLNLKSEVQPLVIMEEATLDIIVSMVIHCLNRTVANNARYKMIFLVHAEP